MDVDMIHFIFHLTVNSTRQISDSFTQIPDFTMVEIYSVLIHIPEGVKASGTAACSTGPSWVSSTAWRSFYMEQCMCLSRVASLMFNLRYKVYGGDADVPFSTGSTGLGFPVFSPDF